jgi:hypothetical protein
MPNHRFDRCDGQHKMVDCSANLGVGHEAGGMAHWPNTPGGPFGSDRQCLTGWPVPHQYLRVRDNRLSH